MAAATRHARLRRAGLPTLQKAEAPRPTDEFGRASCRSDVDHHDQREARRLVSAGGRWVSACQPAPRNPLPGGAGTDPYLPESKSGPPADGAQPSFASGAATSPRPRSQHRRELSRMTTPVLSLSRSRPRPVPTITESHRRPGMAGKLWRSAAAGSVPVVSGGAGSVDTVAGADTLRP
jgi:hypothetical protein